MIIYPALDLLAGNCVRLYQGNYAHATHYSPNPHEIIDAFIEQGAQWLHLVDLSGAQNPSERQDSFIHNLIRHYAKKICIQVGGGIREKTHIQKLLDLGAARVIVGSLAVNSPSTARLWLNEFGCEKMAFAFDVLENHDKEFVVATHAWKNLSNYRLFDFCELFASFGAKHIICTDISRDGTESGPNCDLYQKIIAQFPGFSLQASGGVHALSDIQQLKNNNIHGVIIGRALYEKRFTLQEANAC